MSGDYQKLVDFMKRVSIKDKNSTDSGYEIGSSNQDFLVPKL